MERKNLNNKQMDLELQVDIMLKCPHCGGRFEKKIIPYKYNGIMLGNYKAEVCNTCNAVYFTEKSFQQIEERAKELGVWGKRIS